MFSITLQSNDNQIVTGDTVGQIQFAASSESDGGAAIAIAGGVYCKAEGSFFTSSNPTSIVLATASADASAAVDRVKVNKDGHFVPVTDDVYDIGSSSLQFKTSYFSEGVVLESNTPASTTNKLYNEGGTLKFDGSAVGGSESDTLQTVTDRGASTDNDITMNNSALHASGVAAGSSGITSLGNLSVTAGKRDQINIATNEAGIHKIASIFSPEDHKVDLGPADGAGTSNGTRITIAGDDYTFPSVIVLQTADTPRLNIIADGRVGINNVSPLSQLDIVNSTASNVGLTVQGTASQSANMTEWRASDDVVIAKVEPDGSIYSSGNIGASGDITSKGDMYVGYGTKIASSNNGRIDFSAGGVALFGLSNGGATLPTNGYFAFGSNYLNPSRARIYSDADNQIDIRYSTNAQTLNVYGSYSDASNYERGTFKWDSSVLKIGTEKAGTGSSRSVDIIYGGTRAVRFSTITKFYQTVKFNSSLYNIGESPNNSSPGDIWAQEGMFAGNSSTPGRILAYNSYSDASNYERGGFNWNTTSNVLTIGTEALGTGVGRPLYIESAEDLRLTCGAGDTITFYPSNTNSFGLNNSRFYAVNEQDLGSSSFRFGTVYANTLDQEIGTSTDVGHIIKGATSQSADLAQYQNSAGTVIASIDSDGDITSREFVANSGGSVTGVFRVASETYLQIGAKSNSTISILANNLERIRVSSSYTYLTTTIPFSDTYTLGTNSNRFSTIYGKNLDLSQDLNATGLITAATGVALQRNTPATTTDKLYNVGGALYFNGSAVSNPAGDPSGIAFFGDDGSLTGDTDLITGFGTNGRRIGINSVANPTSQLTVGNQVANQSAIADIRNYGFGNSLLQIVATSGGRSANIKYTSGSVDWYQGHLQASMGGLGGRFVVASYELDNTKPLVYDSNGDFVIGGMVPSARLTVNSRGTTTVNTAFKATASQTANMTEWRASDGVVIAHVSADGSIASSGTITAGDLLVNVGGTQRLYGLGTEGDTDSHYLQTNWDGGFYRIGAKATGVGGNKSLMLDYAGASRLLITASEVRIYKYLRPSDTTIDIGRDANRFRTGYFSNVDSVDGSFSGSVNASGVNASGLLLHSHVPASTTNTLYNDGGTLMFDGSAVGGGGGGSMTTVKSNGSQVGGADIVTLDFSSNFTATETPDTEINIELSSSVSTDTLTLTKAYKSSVETNSDGATITFDLNESNLHEVTLGGGRTLAISNETVGQRFILKLKQDGTGSRTVTWFSTIKWPGGLEPTLTETAGKADYFSFVVTGTDTYDGFVIGYNL